MERTLGIEEARARLGEIAESAGENDEPVVLAKRGRALAVIVDVEEYARFKEHSSRAARATLQKVLPKIQADVERAGLDSRLVRQAIDAAAGLE